MAASRAKASAVEKIIDTSLNAEQIQVFIADASLWVTEELASLASPPSDDRLEVIERWLAAALIRVRDLGLQTASIKDVKEQYQVDPEVTDYLLRAASFDPTGTVRDHFLAAKPVAAAESAPISPVMEVGTGFADEAAEVE